MMIKPDEILTAVPLFERRITAVVAKGSITGAAPDAYPKNWLWDSNLNYTVLEVVVPIKEFSTPFVQVLGFETLWFNN
jgi:hypothetical protein